MAQALSWIELDSQALIHNLRLFKAGLSKDTRLMAVVKGEGYGHGMLPVAQAASQGGADWLGVFHLAEGIKLREAGMKQPILILGYVPLGDLAEAIDFDLRITVSSMESLQAAALAAKKSGKTAFLHLKVETGTHRLGLDKENLDEALRLINEQALLELEGAHTHFANIEDTTEHGYAKEQLARFKQIISHIRKQGFQVPLPHTACTAAAVLFPETHFAVARVGIGIYGLWPSKETYLSALLKDKQTPELQPAMCWKTIVVQIKQVPTGAYVGYGCSYRTTRPTRLAILPVGYANGYDRLLSNRGHVLIDGQRAPIRGRVCMNLCMVDITDIPNVALEDEVVLLGGQGKERITAEQMAAWAQTINYEVVTRADPHAPRRLVAKETRGPS